MRYIFDTICPSGVVVGFILYRIWHSKIYRNQELIVSRERSEYIAKDLTMKEKNIQELAVELTIEITQFCDTLKGRSVFVNQLLRSCSSIGANDYEAKYAQSTADFVSKLEIALKESSETDYWLEILNKVGSRNEELYIKLKNKNGTIRRKLIASITTAKDKHLS